MPELPPLNIYTLPLFPLGSVLFPHFPLQLHVFEERYKVMINGCIERNEPFGVVLIQKGSEVGEPATPCDIGCIARILAVEKLPDGRMNLLAAGDGRFRLLDYVEAELPYLLGKVEDIQDENEPEEDITPLLGELTGLFIQYLSLLADRADIAMPDLELPEDPALLTFCIASVVQLDQEDKQRLLEMTTVVSRVDEEINLLTRQVEELEAERVRAASRPADSDELAEGEEGAEGVEANAAPTVMVAMPIDVEKRRWQRYREDGRN